MDENTMWIIIAVIAAILLLVFLLILVYRKPKEQAVEVVSDNYLNNLLNILGTNQNIKEVSIENKRLRLILVDVKKVDANGLKSLEIPAFLKGNELKLLIKNDIKTIYKFLDERSANNE
ncbi:MAG TPA: hypothetical protein GX742_03350 [Acholeplasmataceae bacterium]|nr:hypothetical protein [Acholeplasmataceae bacterium]